MTVSEEFMEHCTEGALSIEVWGHRSMGYEPMAGPGWEIDPVSRNTCHCSGAVVIT